MSPKVKLIELPYGLHRNFENWNNIKEGEKIGRERKRRRPFLITATLKNNNRALCACEDEVPQDAVDVRGQPGVPSLPSAVWNNVSVIDCCVPQASCPELLGVSWHCLPLPKGLLGYRPATASSFMWAMEIQTHWALMLACITTSHPRPLTTLGETHLYYALYSYRSQCCNMKFT